LQVERVKTNGSAIETMRLMHCMVDRYYLDMAPYAHYSLLQIYNTIKAIPFREDPPEEETLQRPIYTMQQRGTGGDCDDKAIVLASWARLHNIPFRFVAVRRPDKEQLHHVFPELYIMDRWLHCDPTYAFNVLGREREAYAERVYV